MYRNRRGRRIFSPKRHRGLSGEIRQHKYQSTRIFSRGLNDHIADANDIAHNIFKYLTAAPNTRTILISQALDKLCDRLCNSTISRDEFNNYDNWKYKVQITSKYKANAIVARTTVKDFLTLRNLNDEMANIELEW